MIKRKRVCSWCKKSKKDTISLMKVWSSPKGQYVVIREGSYHTVDCYCCSECAKIVPIIKED